MKILKDKADELLKQFREESKKTDSTPPTIPLYHYTSFRNLQRIINNRELCFTDYSHLNDPTEISYSFNIIRDVVKNRKPFGKDFWGEFQDVLSAMIDREYFEKIRHKFPDIESMKTDIYTFSFCEEEDYLPLWRYYGDNGQGISIGFRPEFFKQTEPKDIKRNNPKPVYLPVSYDKEKFEKILNERFDFAERIIEGFKNHVHKYNISLEDSGKYGVDLFRDINSMFAAWVLSQAPGLKHHGYKDEKEHRLYYLEREIVLKGNHEPLYYPYDPFPADRKGERERENETKGICLPHVEKKIPFVKSDKFSLDDIGEIWVGPAVHYECAREQIIKILAKAGYDIDKIDKDEGIKIKKSRAPYR